MEHSMINDSQELRNFQMSVYAQAIKALLKGMQLNRGYTSTNCRSFVTSLTGNRYPAGKKGLELALMDLEMEMPH